MKPSLRAFAASSLSRIAEALATESFSILGSELRCLIMLDVRRNNQQMKTPIVKT